MKTLDQIHDLVRQRKYAEAEAALREVHDANPDVDPQFTSLLGRVLLLRRRPEEALKYLVEVSELLTEDKETMSALGRSLSLTNSGVFYLQTAMALDPEDFRSAYRLGRLALRRGFYQVARSAFAQARALQPDSTPSLVGEGMAAFWRNNWADAQGLLNEAQKIRPNDPEISGYLGFSMLYRGTYDQAEQCIRLALARAPNWIDAYLRMAELKLRQHRYEEALIEVRSALAIDPEHQWAAYFHGLVQFQIDQDPIWVREMEDAATKLISIDTPSLLPTGISTAWFRLSVCYHRCEMKEEAVNAVTRAIELAPTRPGQHLKKVEFLLDLGRYDEAIEYLDSVGDQVKAVIAANNRLYYQIDLLMGQGLAGLGDIQEALQIFSQLVARDPDRAEGHKELGRSYLELGDLKRAEDALATASRLDIKARGLAMDLKQLEVQLGRPMNREAGLADLEEFVIPEEFALKVDHPSLTLSPKFFHGLKIHFRIIWAILRRETVGRFARNRLGYLWAILQPVMLLATFVLIMSYFRDRELPFGMTMITFLMTGIVPVLTFFMETESRTSQGINAAKGLVYYQGVTVYNVMVAQALLQFLTAITVFFIITVGLFIAGENIPLHDPLKVLFGLMLLSFLGMVLGGFFGLVSLMFPSAMFFSRSINRLAFFLSGAFFSSRDIPPEIREYLMLNPLFHGVEFIREGFFPTYEAIGANWTYPLQVAVIGFMVMLTLERVSRRHLFAT